MPVSPPLTTTESGTATSVRPTNTLEFNGADFTVTGSGDKATISIDSTGTGAALTDTYVGFGNASNLMTGSAALTYDDTNNILKLGPKTGGLTAQLRFNDADAVGANEWRTEFRQSGASLYVDNTDVDGSVSVQVARLSNSYARWNYTQANINFSIGTTGSATLVWVDGGNDNVGIGGAADSAVKLHVQTDALASVIQRWETTAAPTTADFAVKLEVKADGTPVANSSGLGCIDFIGKDSGGADTTYARMAVVMADKGAGTEDGILKFDIIDGGVDLIEHMSMGNGNVVINEDSKNVDFRVEGNSVSGLIRTVANQDNLGIGGQPDSDVERLHVKGTAASATDPLVRLESTDEGGTAAPTLQLFRNSDSPIIGDVMGRIEFAGEDDGGSLSTYTEIDSTIRDTSAGSENGDIRLRVRKSGTFRTMLRARESEVVVNEDSVDCNFRVESNSNSEMFRVDAGASTVSVGSAPTLGGATLQVPNNTISSYANVVASTVSPMTLTNTDLQSMILVHPLASALTVNLPLDGGTKGQYFQFVSTSGDVTIVPSAAAGDTINGGTASLTRSTNNEIYDCLCIAANTWVLSNPA